MRSATAIVVAGIFVLSLSPCEAQNIGVKRTQFPGFSIELPAGNVIEDSKEPSGGQHLRLLAEGPLAGIPHLREPLLQVLWLTESMSYEEFRDQFLPAMAAHQPNAMPGERVLREMRVDDTHWLALYGTPGVPIGIAMAKCGPAFSVSIKLRLHDSVDSQLATTRMLLESIRCASTDKLPKRPEAAVRFGSTFGRVGSAPTQKYRSLDGEHIIIGFTQGEVFSDFEEWRGGTLSAMEMELRRPIQVQWSRVVRIEERPDFRATRLLRVDLPGDPRPIYFGGLQCEDLRLSFLVSIELPRADDTLAARRLAQVGCPGDKTEEPQPFPEVAASACKKGNAMACTFSH